MKFIKQLTLIINGYLHILPIYFTTLFTLTKWANVCRPRTRIFASLKTMIG